MSPGTDSCACTVAPAASSTVAATVTRFAPSRSAISPAGAETASVARPGAEMRNPLTAPPKWSSLESSGSSGTIALWVAEATNRTAWTITMRRRGLRTARAYMPLLCHKMRM